MFFKNSALPQKIIIHDFILSKAYNQQLSLYCHNKSSTGLKISVKESCDSRFLFILLKQSKKIGILKKIITRSLHVI